MNEIKAKQPEDSQCRNHKGQNILRTGFGLCQEVKWPGWPVWVLPASKCLKYYSYIGVLDHVWIVLILLSEDLKLIQSRITEWDYKDGFHIPYLRY